MSSASNIPEPFDDTLARPEGRRYARRGACVLNTLCQSASVVAYDEYRYEADLRCTESRLVPFPTEPASTDSTGCRKRSISQVEDGPGYEAGARDIKRRGSADR